MNCWLWDGKVNAAGYGSVSYRSAHVAAFEEVYGPVPDGQELHHICENKLCVNPSHLLPLTRSQHRRLISDLRGLFGIDGSEPAFIEDFEERVAEFTKEIA